MGQTLDPRRIYSDLLAVGAGVSTPDRYPALAPAFLQVDLRRSALESQYKRFFKASITGQPLIHTAKE
jgi:hypothetical protein